MIRFKELLVESINVEDALKKRALQYSSVQQFINSLPLVYHGSGTPLKAFDNNIGTWFTDDYMNADGYAGGENVYEGRLFLQNPIVINGRGRKWDNLSTKFGSSTQEIVRKVDSTKYDGVMFNNIKDSWIDDADAQDAGNVFYAYRPADSFVNESLLTEIYQSAHKEIGKI